MRLAGAAPTLRYGPTGDSAPRLRLKAAGMTERFPFCPSTRPPLSPREQRVSPDRPAAVQGAKRRSEPLTARTDLQSSAARERGFKKTKPGDPEIWNDNILYLPDIALRGIPDPLHRELKLSASRNHRSLNGEILARLTESVSPEPVDPQALLDRIRQRNETLGPVDLSEDTLREMRDTGRP